MNVLLTNDDGIQSSSLQKLAARLRREHNVWIVAPHKQRSACSQSITLDGAIKVKQEQAQEFSCWGTPTDCVVVSVLGLVPVELDCVISGINYGPNIGTDILYSGTAAGARQGAIMRKAAIAASIHGHTSFEEDFPVEFLARNLSLFHKMWTPGHFININFPNLPGPGNGVAVCLPSQRIYNDRLTRYDAPDGCAYLFLTGEAEDPKHEQDDYYAIKHNRIAVSPVWIFPENEPQWHRYRQVNFWEG